MKKATVVILTQLNIKKIKSTKTILEKIIKKNMRGNTRGDHFWFGSVILEKKPV